MPLCVGWKSICKLLDCKDPKTARKWVKRYHLPVAWLGGRPTISVAQFEDWWNRLEKKALATGANNRRKKEYLGKIYSKEKI